MTKERTIEVLSEIRSGYNCFDESERRFYEALCVAIEALSNTPNTLEALEITDKQINMAIGAITYMLNNGYQSEDMEDALNAVIRVLLDNNSDNENDDLIRRQSVINAIENTDAKMSMEEWNEITDAVMGVPSAQPEIVRCKDCRHGVDYYHDGDCYCSNPKWGLKYFDGSWEFYCADAERRTDE